MKRCLMGWLLLMMLAPGCAADDDSSAEPIATDDDDDNDSSPEPPQDDDNDDDDNDDDLSPPSIVWTACRDFFPEEQWPLLPAGLTCGEIEAPVDWLDAGDERTLAVRFALAPATGKKPLGLLAVNLGGPATNLRNALLLTLRPAGLLAFELNESFALLFVEPRGASASSTPLICPDNLLELPYSKPRGYRALVRACLARLPHDVSSALMSTVDAAHDLEWVRRALGAGRLRLFGSSYGSRLMLEYLRLYPERVAAYLLDSTLPPQVDGRHDIDRILQTLAADCDAAATCPTGDGETLMTLTETLLDESAKPGPGGDELTLDLFHLGDRPTLVAMWPAVAAEAGSGNWAPLISWHDTAADLRGETVELPTNGETFAFDPYEQHVMCLDFPGWNTLTDQTFIMRRLTPPYVPFAQIQRMSEINCEELARLHTRPPTVDRTPVASGVPGLLIAPRLDQATPYLDALKAVNEGLTGAQVVTVNADHAVLVDLGEYSLGLPEDQQRCLRELVVDWLTAPFDPLTRPCVGELTAPLSLAAFSSLRHP